MGLNKDKLPPEKPPKISKGKLSNKAKITIVVFIATMLLVATIIMFVVMWKSIVGFFKSDAFTVVFLVLLAMLIMGVSSFVVAKIKEHNGDGE